ncbi:MAG: sigma-70 family RNA polymerase sigma factor [Candidatus Sulfotelmatobacter sp.]
MKDKGFPIDRSDVHYNAETQEVTLPREKFDALIGYVRDLVERASAADDERDIAEYRERRAKVSESVLQEMLSDVADLAAKSVSRWLESHSIRQLSERSGIPYASCHRIVSERLGASRVDMETLSRLAGAIRAPEIEIRQRRLSRGEVLRPHGDDSLPREIADWSPNPERQYTQAELREILGKTIQGLSQGFRTVFVLRDVEGLSTEETAAALDLSVPAVKSRLLRARLQLRDRLNSFFHKRESGGSSQGSEGAEKAPLAQPTKTAAKIAFPKLYDNDIRELVDKLRGEESEKVAWSQHSRDAKG